MSYEDCGFITGLVRMIITYPLYHTVYHPEENSSHHWLSVASASTYSLSAASSDVCKRH